MSSVTTDPLFTYTAAMDAELSRAVASSDSPFEFDLGRLRDEIASCSRDLWGVDELRPRQLETIATLFDPRSPDRAIYVDGTGAGKSHAMRVAGGLIGGVTMIFIPLLTLSADVLEKFKTNNDVFGEVNVSHLDELYEVDPAQYASVLERVRELDEDTDSTHFIFLSPQFLVRHRDACDVFLDAVRRRVVGLIVMDEAHVHVQHGTSFREEIRELRDIFFRQVFAELLYRPLFLTTTATLPQDYVQDLGNLVAMSFPRGAVLRGSPESFRQREIEFRYSVVNTADFVKRGLPRAVEKLKGSDDSIVIFVNTRTKAMHLTPKLEKKCDEVGCKVDVLSLNGALNKHDKFWRIRFFCDP